ISIVGLAAGAAAPVAVPILARAIRVANDARRTFSEMWMASAITFPLLPWLATVSAPLLIGRGGSELSPAPAVICAILATGVGTAASGVATSSAFYAAGLIGRMVAVGGMGAVLNVALDLALIPEHGMLGAATASASAQLIVSCVGFYLAARSL